MTLKAKNCLGVPDFTDMKSQKNETENIPTEVVRIPLLTDKTVQREEVIYDKIYEIDERVKALSDEELVYLGIGNFAKKMDHLVSLEMPDSMLPAQQVRLHPC